MEKELCSAEKVISFTFPDDFGDQLAQKLNKEDLARASHHGEKFIR